MYLNHITYASRNLFTSRINCDIAVRWHIFPTNRSPSFNVFAVFPLHEIADIFACGKRVQVGSGDLSILLSIAV